jgi:hypothetical protein
MHRVTKAITCLVVVLVVASCGDDTGNGARPTTTDEPAEDRTTTTTTTEPETTTTTAPPEPRTYEGVGDDVIEIEKPEGSGTPAIARVSHQGERNFIVAALDENLDRVDGLVNEIGAYEGTVPLDFLDREETVFIEVNADGNWQITLDVLESVRAFGSDIEGAGDDVIMYTGDATPATISHEGERNFIVRAYTDRSAGLVNEIGPYEGTVALPELAVIVINADGTWSITSS